MISNSSEVLFLTIWGRFEWAAGAVVGHELRHVEGPADSDSKEAAKVCGVDTSKTVETPFAFS